MAFCESEVYKYANNKLELSRKSHIEYDGIIHFIACTKLGFDYKRVVGEQGSHHRGFEEVD